MQNFEITLDLSNYTVLLYKEFFGKPHPIGSGVLICFQGQYLLMTANHVVDLEDERMKIENDPDEINIPQDDMEGIMAKGRDAFFYINDNIKAMVFTAHYDSETNEVVFNDDIEWCVCELSESMVECFIDNGKTFYKINKETSQSIKLGSHIIVSGYPGYVQKENQEIYRSFVGELIENFKIDESGLFRVRFNHSKAYSIEHARVIQIPPVQGISGMSGGGLWYKDIDKYILLGIIIEQDPNENYIEGYSLDKILNSYLQKTYE